MNYLIQVSVCFITLYLFYFVLLRRDKFFNLQRAFLLGSLALSLIVPSINFSPEVVQQIVPVEELSFTITSLATDQTKLDNSWGFLDYLQVAYSIGLFLMAIWFVKNLSRLFTIIRKGAKEKLGRYIIVRTDEEIPLASFHKFIFIQNSLSIEDKDLTYLMLHEKKHIRDYHSLDLVAISILKVFFWFNPILWLYEKDLKSVHEFICDDEVIKHTSKTYYEKLLIKSLFEGIGLPFASSFNEISIKNRIIMMNKQNSIWIKKLKVLISLPVIFLLALACNPESLPSATPLEISGKVVAADGKGLPGTNVVVDGTKKGTVTNLEGEYRIGNLDETAKSLTFSFVGFESETVEINSKSVIDVVLEEGTLEPSSSSTKPSNATKIDVQYEIDINDGEKFSGRLMDLLGNPLDGYQVLALGAGKDAKSTKTDKNGDFEFASSKIMERFVVYDGAKNYQVVQIKKN